MVTIETEPTIKMRSLDRQLISLIQDLINRVEELEEKTEDL